MVGCCLSTLILLNNYFEERLFTNRLALSVFAKALLSPRIPWRLSSPVFSQEGIRGAKGVKPPLGGDYAPSIICAIVWLCNVLNNKISEFQAQCCATTALGGIEFVVVAMV